MSAHAEGAGWGEKAGGVGAVKTVKHVDVAEEEEKEIASEEKGLLRCWGREPCRSHDPCMAAA